MSQENVDRVFYELADAFNRCDQDAFLALWDEDAELVSRLVAIEGAYHGHDGIRRWWESVFDAWPDLTFEVVALRAIKDDLTLATVIFRGHGGGSGVPVEQMQWHVARWRDKKTVWLKVYAAEAEALEAVGLSEQDAHADS
jgi:ketosteroid isomerase-like protein